MQKKIKALCLLLSLMLPLSACSQSVQIDDMAFVKIIGIDKCDKDLKITVGIELPQKENDKSSDIGESITVLSETIAEGLSLIEAKSEKKIFYGQISAVLLGEEAARDGISAYTDYFVLSKNFRFDLPVIIVKDGSSEEIIRASNGDKTHLSEQLETLLKSARASGAADKIKLSTVVEMTESDEYTLYLPYLTANNDEKEIGGFGIFEGDRLKSYLNKTASVGLSILNNTIDGNTQIIEYEGCPVTVKATEFSSKKKLKDGIFEIKIKLKTEILQYDCNADFNRGAFTSAVNDKYYGIIENTLETLKDENLDAAQLCIAYRDAGGKEFADFQETFNKKEYNITVNSEISKEGTAVAPKKNK